MADYLKINRALCAYMADKGWQLSEEGRYVSVRLSSEVDDDGDERSWWSHANAAESLGLDDLADVMAVVADTEGMTFELSRSNHSIDGCSWYARATATPLHGPGRWTAEPGEAVYEALATVPAIAALMEES